MAAHSWANLFWSHFPLCNLCPASLQHQHIKLLPRDPSTPTNDIGGLGVPINFLPLLLVLGRSFLSPTYREDIICNIAVTNCCGLTPMAWAAFNFSISQFCFLISSIWAWIFLSLLLFFFLVLVFCSFNAPDELMLFVAVFNFSALIHKPNMEIHLAQNWVKFILWLCIFNKLHAIATKYGAHNHEAN